MIFVLLNIEDINVQKKIFYFYRILYFLNNLEYCIFYFSKFVKNNLNKFINKTKDVGQTETLLQVIEKYILNLVNKKNNPFFKTICIALSLIIKK